MPGWCAVDSCRIVTRGMTSKGFFIALVLLPCFSLFSRSLCRRSRSNLWVIWYMNLRVYLLEIALRSWLRLHPRLQPSPSFSRPRFDATTDRPFAPHSHSYISPYLAISLYYPY